MLASREAVAYLKNNLRLTYKAKTHCCKPTHSSIREISFKVKSRQVDQSAPTTRVRKLTVTLAYKLWICKTLLVPVLNGTLTKKTPSKFEVRKLWLYYCQKVFFSA